MKLNVYSSKFKVVKNNNSNHWYLQSQD